MLILFSKFSDFLNKMIQATNITSFASICQDVKMCMIKEMGSDPLSYMDNCIKKSKCDEDCQANMHEFEECSANCKCNSMEDEFPWTCYNTCHAQLNNTETSKVIKCFYDPCRATDGSTFWILIGIFISVLAICVAGFFFYRWKEKKAASNSNPLVNLD